MAKKKKKQTSAETEFTQLDSNLIHDDGFPVVKVVLGVFTGIAVLMLAVTGFASYNNIRKINREQSAPAAVVEMIARPEYDEQDFNRVVGEIHYPVVEFVVNDKRYTVELNEGSDPPAYEVGDAVTVLYEPDNPNDARIQSASSSALMWVLPSITGVLGLGFLAAVIGVWVVMRRDGDVG